MIGPFGSYFVKGGMNDIFAKGTLSVPKQEENRFAVGALLVVVRVQSNGRVGSRSDRQRGAEQEPKNCGSNDINSKSRSGELRSSPHTSWLQWIHFGYGSQQGRYQGRLGSDLPQEVVENK